jgi:hypothetical protein
MKRLEVSGAVRPLKWPLGVKWLSNLFLRFGLPSFLIVPLPIPFYLSFLFFCLSLSTLSYAPHSYFFPSIPSFIRHLISNSLIHERFYLSWGLIKISLSLLLSFFRHVANTGGDSNSNSRQARSTPPPHPLPQRVVTNSEQLML